MLWHILISSAAAGDLFLVIFWIFSNFLESSSNLFLENILEFK